MCSYPKGSRFLSWSAKSLKGQSKIQSFWSLGCLIVSFHAFILLHILHPARACIWKSTSSILVTIQKLSGFHFEGRKWSTGMQHRIFCCLEKWREESPFCEPQVSQEFLVGGWTTHLKNISQIGSFPQIGMKFETATQNLPRHESDDFHSIETPCICTSRHLEKIKRCNPYQLGHSLR